MKHLPIKRFAIFIFALWLPIQSGTAMAACKHILPHDSGAPTAHDLAASLPPAHDDGSAACEECDLCYIACAAVLPARATAMIPSVASAPAAPASRRPQLFFPQQPHRPPLASA